MAHKKIDIDLSLSILANHRAGKYSNPASGMKLKAIPRIDNRSVIDLRRESKAIDQILWDARDLLGERLAKCGFSGLDGKRLLGMLFSTRQAGTKFSALEEIGYRLIPKTAFGVLNGGSATSYVDYKKNLGLGPGVFSALRPYFLDLAGTCKDVPKGVTPAYINPDGSLGESFLGLKLRARLLALKKALKYHPLAGAPSTENQFPLVQMTSDSTQEPLLIHYESLKKSPLLSKLAEELALDPVRWHTGVQPLISAYTHSSMPGSINIFDRAYGEINRTLPLPGGHGQCFRTLAPILRQLHSTGIKFFCLGNVDNIGYLPDPIELAVVALSGRPAGFDFSIRSSMDIKGGILADTADGRRTVADIGPAIQFSHVVELERSIGQSALFNCATGVFDLDWLVPRLDWVATELPMRFSDQDKDAGRYSQAEQVTWEVMGILPSFVAFVVDKDRRFLAAKLLIETLLTSGIGLDHQDLPEDTRATAIVLNKGLQTLMNSSYGMHLAEGRWVPV